MKAPKTRAAKPPEARAAAARATKPLLEPAQARELLYSKRYLAADRANVELSEITTWDKYLLREHRLLVPIDVPALYVP